MILIEVPLPKHTHEIKDLITAEMATKNQRLRHISIKPLTYDEREGRFGDSSKAKMSSYDVTVNQVSMIIYDMSDIEALVDYSMD